MHGRRVGAVCSGSGASGERVRRVGHAAGGAGGRISEALLIDIIEVDTQRTAPAWVHCMAEMNIRYSCYH